MWIISLLFDLYLMNVVLRFNGNCETASYFYTIILKRIIFVDDFDQLVYKGLF